MIYRVGMTGTRKGMTGDQGREFYFLLKSLYELGAREFGHGGAEGADRQGALFAQRIGYKIVPFLPKDDKAASMHERNHGIVMWCGILLSTPSGTKELKRGSGTWSTMRDALREGKEVRAVWPDGSTSPWKESLYVVTYSDSSSDSQTRMGTLPLFEK